MSSPTTAVWRCQQAATLGWREFQVYNPPRVMLYTALPRVVLQTVFFTALGEVVGGAAHRRFAFVGALAIALTLMTAVGIADVPVHDKWSGTFGRIRGGRLPTFATLLSRVWPYPVFGFFFSVVALVVVAPLVGLRDLGWSLLPLLPLYALMALTTAAAGLAGAVLAVGRRADVLVGNLLMYLLILTSGALLPAGRVWLVDQLGVPLPMRHGLAAVRTALAGEPWWSHALAEAAVGGVWLVLAGVITGVQVWRARRSGHDDFD